MDTNDKKLITKFVVIFLGTATIFVAVQVLFNLREFKFIGRTPGSISTITVTGTGEVSAKPDVAEVSFAISKDGKTVSEVQSQASDIEKKVIAFLKEKGIADKDVKTVNYSLSPRYEYKTTVCSPTYCPPTSDNRTLIGYEVRQDMLVKVRAIDTAGEIIGGLGTLGVTDVSGINLTLDDPDKTQRDARAEAISDAKQKAEELANDLGVNLRTIVSFSDRNGGTPTPIYMEKLSSGMGMDTAVSSTPTLPTGENTYSSSVSITYEIE